MGDNVIILLIMTAVAFSMVVVLSYIVRRRIWAGTTGLKNATPFLGPLPSRQSEGLIMCASPNANISLAVVRFHLPVLQHCWILEGFHLPGAGHDIALHFQDTSVQFHVYTVDPDEIFSSKQVVNQILKQDVPATSLRRDQLIANVSGGTPPMVLGLAHACGPDVPLEYISLTTTFVETPGNEIDETPIFLGFSSFKA